MTGHRLESGSAPPPPLLSLDEARSVIDLAPGDQVIYWRGNLAADRQRSDRRGEIARRLALAAMTHVVQGGAFVVQRRTAGGWENILIRRRGRR